MSKRFHLLLILTLLSVAHACAEDKFDPFAENAFNTPGPPNPDHLEPIRAYDEDGYAQAVFKSLLGDGGSDTWMIVKPSFSPEFAIILRHIVKRKEVTDSSDPFGQTQVESEKWTLEYAVARKKIWQWKEINDGRDELDIKVTKEVDRKSIEIPEDFSKQIQSAWSSVLQDTRYSKTDDRGTDGTTYQFGTFMYSGETWSPSSGRPKALVDLGAELIALVKSEESVREEHSRKCLELAARLKRATPSDAEQKK